MDIGTISLILLFGMLGLLAIGMPLGFASGFLAVVVLVLKFGPDLLLSNFGTGPLNILAQRIYGVTTEYVLISVPLFILMATLLERSGIARDMYSSLNNWLSRTRGGIAIVTALMAIVMAAMSGIIGGEVVLLGLIALPQMLRLGYNQNLAVGRCSRPPSCPASSWPGAISSTSSSARNCIRNRRRCPSLARMRLRSRTRPSAS
jgi:TRAP-type mannitol/chloroaromatic compound transport system permease large subunit